jgi:hypothetical protein
MRLIVVQIPSNHNEGSSKEKFYHLAIVSLTTYEVRGRDKVLF